LAQAAGSMKLAAIIERAHAEARKIADMAIAEISCPTRARDVNSSATEAVPPPPGGQSCYEPPQGAAQEPADEPLQEHMQTPALEPALEDSLEPVTGAELDDKPVLQVEDDAKKRKHDTYRIPAEIFPIGPSRPSDNYEMTDGEDEEIDGYAKKRRKKAVPEWCSRYVQDVVSQANVDPDSIFGTAPICDLEQMFGKRRRFGRGSSCDWTMDKLSSDEVLAYKEAVGRSEPVQILIDSSEAHAH